MRRTVLAVVSTVAVAALAGGMIVLERSPRVVEVKEELPIRQALEHFVLPTEMPAYQSPSALEISKDELFEDEDSGPHSTPDANVIDTAAKFEKFGMLVAAARATGLVEELRSSKNITIFAPTNSAFAQLPEHVFEQLLKPENSATLRKIISGHIVPKKVVWSDLFGRKTRLRTIGGSFLNADGSQGIRVNGVRLQLSDVLATNGVIHVVDKLIVPVTEKPPVM